MIKLLQNNVVVVGQPVADAPVKVEVQQPGPRPNDFLIFSIVLMVLCLIHLNFPSVPLTVPALICSIVVSFAITTQHAYHAWTMTLKLPHKIPSKDTADIIVFFLPTNTIIAVCIAAQKSTYVLHGFCDAQN